MSLYGMASFSFHFFFFFYILFIFIVVFFLSYLYTTTEEIEFTMVSLAIGGECCTRFND